MRLKWCGFTSGLRSVNADADPGVIKSCAKKGGALKSNPQDGQEKNRERPPEWQATAEFTHLETWTRPPPSSSSSIARVFTHTHLSIAGRSHRITFFSLSLLQINSSLLALVVWSHGEANHSNLFTLMMSYFFLLKPRTPTLDCAHLHGCNISRRNKTKHTHQKKLFQEVLRHSPLRSNNLVRSKSWIFRSFFFFYLSDITTLEASGPTASKQNTTSQLPSPGSARWTVSAWSWIETGVGGDVHQGWALRSSGTQLKRREMTLALLCSHWLKHGAPPPPSLLLLLLTHTHTHASLLTYKQTAYCIHSWLYRCIFRSLNQVHVVLLGGSH